MRSEGRLITAKRLNASLHFRQLVLNAESPPCCPIPVSIEDLEDAGFIQRDQARRMYPFPERITANGFRFRRVGDLDLYTLTVPYMWEKTAWRWHRFVHKTHVWKLHWLCRFARLRAAWKG